MSTVVAFNTTIEKIVSEVGKFNKIEQESILAYLRAKRIQKKPKRSLLSGDIKPLSMNYIDEIKHKSRKGARK